MNWRNYLYSAVILFTALLWAFATSSASAELVTFEVHGHMTDAVPPDLAIGDRFVASYTFESIAAGIPVDNGAGVAYDAITSWRFVFEKGTTLISNGSGSTAGVIQVWNNLPQDGIPPLVDRYLATLDGSLITFPSGQRVDYLQFYFDDATPSNDPDLLSGISLPTTPPRIDLADYAVGRFVYRFTNDQPFFEIDSVTVVPEPSTAILSIIGLGLLLAFIGVRRA